MKQVINFGTAPNDGTGDPLRTAFQKTNANFSELYAGVYDRCFDVGEYGAVFDGATDIAGPVQSAIDAARTFLAGGNYRSAKIVFPSGARGVLRSTLNFTGFTNSANQLVVDWGHVCVFAFTNGAPAIDALGSVSITWSAVYISGQSSNTPNVGIQIGRTNTTALNGGGSGMTFLGCQFVDYFTLVALYNFSGESGLYDSCLFSNSTVSSSAYAAILDGINHFSVTSAFVTQLAPANTPQSFNQNTFRRCSFKNMAASSAVSAIWKGGCRQHEFDSCYLYAPPSGYGITEYCVSGTGGVSHGNRYDIHLEGTTVSGYFLLDGTLSNPAFGGLQLRAAFISAKFNVFKVQGSITSVIVRGLLIDMVGEITPAYTETFVVFDSPGIWTVWGVVNIISTSYWNYPSSSQVTLNGVPYLTADMA